jgi:hypothetical protein
LAARLVAGLLKFAAWSDAEMGLHQIDKSLDGLVCKRLLLAAVSVDRLRLSTIHSLRKAFMITVEQGRTDRSVFFRKRQIVYRTSAFMVGIREHRPVTWLLRQDVSQRCVAAPV